MSKNTFKNSSSTVSLTEKIVNPLKLAIPFLDKRTLIRLRLVTEINKGIRGKLTLISAPPGFGKTTLISQWAAQADQKYAYLALDEFDNDPAVFFRHLVACFQKINKNIGAGVIELLQSGKSPSMETVLKRLLEQMGMVLSDFVIIFDNYHRVAAAPVHNMIAYLLEHLPLQAHFIFSSQTDLPFDLSKLRATGMLKEIRAPYLTFTMDEAQALFTTVMKLQVPYGDITALVVRTQSQPAALKYAALCLTHFPTLSEFVAEFENDQRDAEVFLTEILLKNQPKAVQQFVSKIAVLDWINPALATQVTKEKSSGNILHSFSQSGEFVVALSDDWFALQPFVRSILLQQFREKSPEVLTGLHRLAGKWHAENGSLFFATKHALAAEDYTLAAQYIETHAMEMLKNGFLVTIKGWMTALPDLIIASRPLLSIVLAWMKIISEDSGAIETHLQNALKTRQNAPDPLEIDAHVKLIREYLVE